MLTIYGIKQSRAARCMWVLEELRLEYRQVPLNPFAGQTRTPEYLALNPSGKVPTLDHDGFVLTETMAINLYLASTFPGSLLPQDPKQLAKLQQWTSWSLTELESALVAIVREGRRPQAEIDARRIEASRAEAQNTMATVLEPHLARQEFILAGNSFSLADLTVASLVSLSQLLQISLEALPHTREWLERCLAREAYKRAQARP